MVTPEGYPSGTTERERRERDEFAGLVPASRDDEQWTPEQLAALAECMKRVGEDNENHTSSPRQRRMGQAESPSDRKRVR